MGHYYIAIDYKNKETSKVWREMPAQGLPKYGTYKPDDETIAGEMDVVRKYLSEHIRLHGGITTVKITDANGKIPVDKDKQK